jgi:periplasmic protein TonB
MRNEEFLNVCLMDSDRDTKQRTRKRWRRAIILALTIESTLIVWLLLWPVVTPGSPPGNFVLLPCVPYPGTAAEKPAAPLQHARPSKSKYASHVIFEPPRIPTEIILSTDSNPPSINAPRSIGNDRNGDADGLTEIPGVPGNAAWTIARPSALRRPRIIMQTADIQEGMLVHRVIPRYPQLARDARISGTVELRAIIARDGSVRSVEVQSGNPLLVPAAAEAVKQWRYRPTLLDGEAVEVKTLITVRFVLGQEN